jgi:hypothetical protein
MVSILRKVLLSLFLGLYVTLGAADVQVNDSGTWRQPYEIQVNDSGTWRDIVEVYVNDSGTWRKVYDKETLSVVVVSTSSNFGYSSGVGSATPDTFNGQQVTQLLQFTGSFFSIAFTTPGLGATYWTFVRIQRTDGNFTTIQSSACSYSSGATSSWACPGIGIWTAASTRSVTFYK